MKKLLDFANSQIHFSLTVPTDHLLKIVGGYGSDGIDCTSELASGGTTTDTYEPADSIDCTSELASGGSTTDTYE